ncbi:hypothetical protein DXG01_007999 [Tephrocybe rancida]|nr:hypothetical protein DXG01_007999 [Tephrocybe rancida]
MLDVLLAAQPPQPEASTSSTPPQTLCSVCSHHNSKYTCPGCTARTCSLPCSTGHKTATGCTGKRNKVAYVPMNKYSWGTMMDDYVFLEDVGRHVGEWGKEIVKGGYGLHGSGAGRGSALRGRGSDGRGRGRGRGRSGAITKRDVLKMQLEVRDIDMDVLPAGMERRKINQSYWEPKNHTALLTIEFKIHQPRDPLTPSSQLSDPPLVLLTHRNNINTPLLNLSRQATERILSKQDGASHAWIKRFLFPDPDDPNSFTPPQFVMTAQMNPRAAALQKSRHRAAYYRFDPSQTLAVLLRNTHFVEYPTIEVWEEFTGTVVDVQGVVTELPHEDEPKLKRGKLSAKAGKKAINGLLGGYGSEDDEEVEEERPSGLALLGGYAGSDDESGDAKADDDGEEAGGDEDALGETDDEVEIEIDPAVLLELVRHAHGERWTEEMQEGEEVNWGLPEG